MAKILLVVLTAMFLVSCGGGGGPSDPSPAVGVANPPLKAKVATPDPTLMPEPVSVANTTTAGNQVLRSIGATSDGGYTVAWISGTATLSLQRYDSLGAKDGSETQIPVVVEDAVGQAIQFSSVTVLADGRVVVAYRAITHTTLPGGAISTKQGLYFQVFSPAGEQLTAQTEVAAIEEVIHSRSPILTDPQVAALADGGFVVGWTVRTFSALFGYQATLSLRRYDSQGQPAGDAIPVGQFPGLAYSLAADAHGGFALSLSKLDASFQTLVSVVHYDASSTAHPIVAPKTGIALLLPLASGYVLFDSTVTGPFRQMLDSAGNPLGDPTAVASMPVAAHELSDGSYVVFWASGADLSAQRFAADGSPLGYALAIPGAGTQPEVAALVDVGFALAWTGPGMGGDTDVLTQRFIEVPSDRKKACLLAAKGLRGQERKAFMDGCLA